MSQPVSFLPAKAAAFSTASLHGRTEGRNKVFAGLLQREADRQFAVATPDTPSSGYTVSKGDTLVGIAKSLAQRQGAQLSDSQAYRAALDLAASNKIQNPNLIYPGQVLSLNASVQAPVGVSPPSQKPISQPSALSSRIEPANDTPKTAGTETNASTPAHPLLDKTLARAVRKGFIADAQAPEAARKVVALSEKYRFEPDDFARLTLLESGGMNPQASNGHCHGIIQFCDGADRGAAAVGMRSNPRDILGMGLLKQLDLVDAYFDQLGLAQASKPLSLDELYLTVLRPAARVELGRDTPLAIPGRQARHLHVGGNRGAPITRNSIVDGLHALAQQIFNPLSANGRHLSAYASLLSTPGPR